MTKASIPVIFFTLLFFNTTAQRDSLKQAILIATDTTKVNLLIQLGEQQTDSSMYYWNQALSLSKEIAWQYGVGRSLHYIGLDLYKKKQLDSSIEVWNRSAEAYKLDLSAKYSKRTHGYIGNVYYNIAIPEYLQGDYLLAIQNLKKSLDAYLVLKNGERIIRNYNLLGSIYLEQDDLDLAEEQFAQALQYALEIKDERAISIGYNNLANAKVSQMAYSEALKYYELALSSEDQRDTLSLEQTRMNIGQVYIELGRFDEAQKILESGVIILEKSPDIRDRIISLNLLSNVYEAKEEWKKVITMAEKSLSYSDKIGMQNQQKESVENLSLAYEELGDDQTALFYLKQFITYKDSLFNNEKTKEVEALKAQLEFDKKEREIIELNKANLQQEVALGKERNTRNIILFSAGMIFLLIGVIWILYRRQEDRRRHALEMKKLEIEQRMLRSQMNPHFIFNALNSIQSFIATNNGYEAEVFMSKFSLLVRKILENSTHQFITLEEEMETLKLYLELEKSRFEDRIDFEIIDNADSTLNIPPMLLQPFIENAIIHGMKGKNKKGNISVRFLEEEEYLRCEVEDDGVGRTVENINKKHKSLATSLTNERINYFNAETDEGDYELSIIDLKDDFGKPCGTKVILNIPLAS